MSESPINSQIKLRRKNNRKFFGVLRRLAKSDTLLVDKMKVTVYKEDIAEEKKEFIMAPLFLINQPKRLINYKSTENTNEKTIEELIKEEEISSPVDPDLINYPDSSDFDDDE